MSFVLKGQWKPRRFRDVDVSAVLSGREIICAALPDTSCPANFRLCLWHESGAEDAAVQTLREVYAESFKGAAHLDNIIEEAQKIVTAALK